MNIDDANKRVSHLVFYAQSTIAVISGRGNKPNSINMLLTAVKHNLFIFVENALVIKLPKRFRVQGLDWSLIVKTLEASSTLAIGVSPVSDQGLS